MQGLEKKLQDDAHFEQAEFLENSKNYTSYLHDSVYIVQKEGLWGAVCVGGAFAQGANERIIKVLECNKHTIEEAKKVTMVMCEHLCSTFTMEHEAKYYGSGNERRGRVIDRDDAGDMLIQEDYRY